MFDKTEITVVRKAVMFIARGIKKFVTSWSKALKLAWKIVKTQFGIESQITFVKGNGTLRSATMTGIGSLEATIEKGFVRFTEIKNGSTQWRSFRFDRVEFSR